MRFATPVAGPRPQRLETGAGLPGGLSRVDSGSDGMNAAPLLSSPVAALADVIASKRAIGRPRDKAVLDILEATLREQQKATGQR